ncbi:hypothetical protein CC86DRAFT_415377 [Ophiobolus disseminans]|uniref:DUF7918 domain-containing protein n=1 Tax=Ophiobolus disseminans TaxID=1469910 RepID=A0A6A7AJX2_9PLEO|nr:hypothetical protein CC86DRAFT_415377 [Ophiobolus disseminans]
MAIIAALPGLQVTVEAGGEPLAEFDYQPANALQDATAPNMVSRYIEAPSGAEFEIRTLYRPPYNPDSLVQVDIMLDGTYVLYAKATFVSDGISSTQNFRFSDLTTGMSTMPIRPSEANIYIEENDQAVTAEAKRKVSGIGQIVLYLYYIQGLVEANPIEIPRSNIDHTEAISHKVLKATVAPGDSLSHQTSLSEPEVCDRVTYNELRTSTALKSLGILQRTPTAFPEPEPEPKDPDEMTAEELRAELTRLRNEKEEAIRVKREREESVATVAGGDEIDVEWVGTQPAERVAKRMRRIPGEGDEVVDVED